MPREPITDNELVWWVIAILLAFIAILLVCVSKPVPRSGDVMTGKELMEHRRLMDKHGHINTLVVTPDGYYYRVSDGAKCRFD